MNKYTLAEKIISYLGHYNNDEWITTDFSKLGVIKFNVKGISEPILVDPKSNITDGYRYVASVVVQAGFDYGRCKDILEQEDIERKKEEESSNKTVDIIDDMIKNHEDNRVNNLTKDEKLAEITEKYGIKIIQFEFTD